MKVILLKTSFSITKESESKSCSDLRKLFISGWKLDETSGLLTAYKLERKDAGEYTCNKIKFKSQPSITQASTHASPRTTPVALSPLPTSRWWSNPAWRSCTTRPTGSTGREPHLLAKLPGTPCQRSYGGSGQARECFLSSYENLYIFVVSEHLTMWEDNQTMRESLLRNLW